MSFKRLLAAEQEKQKEFFGTEWNETDRLFTAVNGTPIHPDTVSCWFHDFIKRTGLPEVTVHGLHTFTTLMISKGIDIVTVSNLVGHSMPSTTINMYAHAVSERKAGKCGGGDWADVGWDAVRIFKQNCIIRNIVA